MYVLGFFFINSTDISIQNPPTFFHTIYSTIGDFKISTSLISNRYQHCAITSMMTKEDAQQQQQRNHFNIRDWKKGKMEGMSSMETF
jgi:hypothetical protein